MAWLDVARVGLEPRARAAAPAEGADDEAPLALPAGWPPGHPLPTVRSNCVKCHLHAGRELTLAVRDFSHSVHDLEGLTCYDCHGGNPDDDAKAHDDAAGFIGTKLSAHLAKCTECHDAEAEQLALGPHHWDFSKRINTKYPMCLDCHGNHDVANPPPDFKVKDVCLDCHDDLDKVHAPWAAIVEQNDRLWSTLLAVRQRNLAAPTPIPPEFEDEVDGLRAETMQHVHRLGELTPAAAERLNQRAERLRQDLEAWLKQNPTESSSRSDVSG